MQIQTLLLTAPFDLKAGAPEATKTLFPPSNLPELVEYPKKKQRAAIGNVLLNKR